MNSNILDYMYEGYGYGMDNQLLYTDADAFNDALEEKTKMSTDGMETLSRQGITGYDAALDTPNANEYEKEITQFISEEGSDYTDLRQQISNCNA